jgi:hypothetical protein
MSELKVNKISPRSGTDVTLGDSGDTFTIPTGASLTSPGLTLSDNILFNTSSKGIYLGVTSATASNLLDDYEEGTWTPTAVSTGDWSGFASSTVTTYMAQYTKVGRKVSIQGQINFDDSTGNLTAGDSVKIGGLPFNYGGSGDDIYSKVPSQCFIRDGTNGGVCHNNLFSSNQITLRVVATHGSGARSQQGLNLSFTYFTD